MQARDATGLLNAVAVTRDSIAATERLIRPHVRRTPVIETDAAEFGLTPGPLLFK